MGVCNNPDIFQENISELFDGFDIVRSYSDDVLLIIKNNFEDHLKALNRVIQRIVAAGLKVNLEKYFFGRTETEYRGFWVINNQVIPLLSKVEAIKATNVPTKVRDVPRFFGLVKYYRDMWRKRAHTLAPLTKLCSTKFKFKWTEVENNAFIDMKI